MVKLSIITATFNSAETIEATIASILKQSYRPLEFIIIDGDSLDKTLQIIKESKSQFEKNQIEYQFISEPDTGIYNAWNKGLKLATGNWVSFLGSDDEYVEGALMLYAEKIKENPSCDFVTAKAKLIANGQVVREFGEDFNWAVFKREMKVLHAGGFISKGYFEEYGNFDESFKITGDYEHLLRKGEGLRVKVIPDFLVKMGAEGVSSTLIKKSLTEAKRAKVKTGARNHFFATIDFYWVRLKIKLKELLNV